MRVQFDLRPASMLEQERKRTSFNLTRILAVVLLGLFVAASGFCIVMMWTQVRVLQDEVEALEGDVSSMDGVKLALQAEIRGLQARERTFTDTLKIMQDDLPTLEVLNALETHMEYGMGLNSLRFSTGAARQGSQPQILASLEGTAATNEQIFALTNGLGASGVFSDVQISQTNREESTNRVRFTLSLTVLPIGQIQFADR